MSTADVAITALTAAYLATVGAGLKAFLAVAPRLRVAAPPKETVQAKAAELATAKTLREAA